MAFSKAPELQSEQQRIRLKAWKTTPMYWISLAISGRMFGKLQANAKK
jgi:hypothetical protein